MRRLLTAGCFLFSISVILSGCISNQADSAQKDQYIRSNTVVKPTISQDQKQYGSGENQENKKSNSAQSNVLLRIPEYHFEPATLSKEQAQDVEHIKNKSVIFNGSRKLKMVALTFDDGPDDKYTPEILDILKEEHVHATFFIIGKMAQKNPVILKRIVAEGHVIGNHTWDHPFIPKISQSQLRVELDRTKQELKKLTGYQITFFRPPYEAIWGKKSQIVAKGYKIVDWDVDTEDWKNGRTAAGIYQTVVKQVEPGSIILEHCAGGNRQPTVDSLRWIIHYLKDQGYQIVTVDQLLQIPAYENTHPTKRHSS